MSPLETAARPPRVFGMHPYKALWIAIAAAIIVSGILVDSLAGDALAATLAAYAPLPLYIALALWLDRYEPEPWWLLSKCVVWGATVAILAALIVNDAAFAFLALGVGLDGADVLTAVLVAPIVEELAKGAALVLLFRRSRHDFDGVTDGVVYATMVGLGFAASENVLYYGRAYAEGLLGATLVARGIVAPYAHPFFTALFGIALGAATATRGALRIVLPVVGMLAAIALHALWNLAALADALAAVYVLIMAPTFVAILALVRRSRRRERELLGVELAPYVGAGRLDERVYRFVTSSGAARERARIELGYPSARTRRRWQHAAAVLAFARLRVETGRVRPGSAGADWRADREAEERWLRQLQ
jgi:protease PrsW